MQIILTVYKLNNVLFKLLFNYPTTTTIQLNTNEPSSLKTNVYEENIEKIYTIYDFEEDKLCKIFIKFKIINKLTNLLSLEGFDINSEYLLNQTVRIINTID